MNIPHTLHQKPNTDTPTCCPACLSPRFSKHTFYWRKGFNLDPRGSDFKQRIQISRYICHNSECQFSTFSHLPPMVLRVCRFFWPDLLLLQEGVAAGGSHASLAQTWQVGRNVIRRALLLLDKLTSWITTVHQEVSDGSPAQPLQRMVQTMLAKLEWSQLLYRWCKHRYPRRVFAKTGTTQINAVVSTMR